MSPTTLPTKTIHDQRTSSHPEAKPATGRAARAGVLGLLAAAIATFTLAPLAVPESYSWVEHGLSEAAAQSVDGAWVARAGFILFGLAVVWLAHLRVATWPVAATVFHLAFGIAMFGVAAFAAKPWEQGAPYVKSEDSLHTVFSSIVGLGFIGGVICMLISPGRRSWRLATPDLIALAIALSTPLTMSTTVWGLLQRLMFLTAACWYGREAWTLRRTRRE